MEQEWKRAAAQAATLKKQHDAAMDAYLEANAQVRLHREHGNVQEFAKAYEKQHAANEQVRELNMSWTAWKDGWSRIYEKPIASRITGTGWKI
jgi:uncharacterized protein YbcC (UPF0753/DUF2309 family)